MNTSSLSVPPIALTMGDPAGIGPELTVQAWQACRKAGPSFFLVGDSTLVADHVPVRLIDSPEEATEIFRECLPVLSVPCLVPVKSGVPDSRNARAVIQSIETACATVRSRQASAIVTNPIAKHILAASGFSYPGHTEFLAALCDVSGQEVMMLVSPHLRVVLTSIHVPLRQAVDSLTSRRIVEVALLSVTALQRDFGIAHPRLAVAGLNPHAGENGLMGREEQTIIMPALKELKACGIEVTGPMPPDTMFSARARMRYDAAVCLYHDQGLIPLKTLDMDHGVNVTLGLPIIRTSPDHGTAFDIAGKGTASASSLLAALSLAGEMAHHRYMSGYEEAGT